MNSPLYLKQMEVGPMQNFVYLIGDQNTHEALIVDPAWEIDNILAAAKKEGYQVKGALITHTHFDHVNGLEELLNKTDGTVYINKHEAEFLKGMIPPPEFGPKGQFAFGKYSGGGMKANMKLMEGGDKIKIGNVEITMLHTPGHTPGSQCFLVDRNLISGDTLFINACGRCDLPGGNAEQMYHSLKKLSELDEKTILYPGHNYADEPSSTIADEKKHNPYLQTTNLNAFLKYRMGY